MPEVLASLIFTFLVFFLLFFFSSYFSVLVGEPKSSTTCKPEYYTERDEAVVLD